MGGCDSCNSGECRRLCLCRLGCRWRGWNEFKVCCGGGRRRFRCRVGCGCRFQSVKFKLSVLQGLHQSFNDLKALGCLPVIPCPNLEVPMCLEFLRPFTECLAQALAKLQLRLASCGIAVGEAVLAEVMDGRQQFLKFIDAE